MKWLKYGCFGCLGVLAVVAIVVVAVIGIARQRAREMKPEEQVMTRQLPGESPGLPLGAVTGDLGASKPPGPAAPAGRVVLHLSDGEFHIRPAGAGEAARVQASYDHRMYELTESFEPSGDGVWTYAVSFRRTGSSSFLTSIAELISGRKPRVEIALPPDVPLDLQVEASRGGTDAELGGLWLRSADLRFSMGGAQLDFSEPTRQPMEHLGIRVEMGGGSFESLGNASPGTLEVDHSMGGMNLDLRGRWARDATIRIASSMGGGALILPRDVDIVGLEGRSREPAGDGGAHVPTLTFSVDSQMGDLRIVDR